MTYTSLGTSGGLIVPTASLSLGEDEGGDIVVASTTTSYRAGAIPNITTYSDVVRAFEFAALSAVL
jgi:hypothetical protein